MLKEDGRLKPATKEEVASIKEGKSYTCIECGKDFNINNAQFSTNICPQCGRALIEKDTASARKATGA
jgi:predicted RNA-binding Zn-ribbon protein involved in translation (DUF1610 family)